MELVTKNPFDKKTHPNCYSGHQYAVDIVLGNIPANIWVIGSCRRYLRDILRQKIDKDCPFYFREDKAEKYLRIVQKFNHPVGHWKTKNIIYEPWQKFSWMNIKGFYSKKTKMIRFRSIHLDIGRGNAKSTMASQAGLYDLCCDDPKGNRIYCAATSRDQAKEVFHGSKIMADGNKSFSRKFGVEIRAHELLHPKSNSYLKPISAQAKSLDGKIGILVITDELHAMERKTFEVLDSGQSKRQDSQLLSITTAGYSNDGVGYSQRKYAQKVSLGEIEDDTFFALVYTLDEDDDIFDPSVWIKANPNFGVSVDPDNFAAKAKKAKENPEDTPNFKIKHLNIYLDSMNQLMDIKKWRLLRNKSIRLDQFTGKKCFVGLDLSSKIDITSICYMFKNENKYTPFWKNFIPEERLKDIKNRNYLKYVEEGDLIVLPGEVVNLPMIGDIIYEDSKKFKMIDVLFDPWSATELSTRLQGLRVNMVEFRMNTANLSEPTKKFQANIIEGSFEHNTGTMLDWCLGNIVGKYDAVGNIFPRKEHDRMKIDPGISGIMALAGWIQEEEKISVYEHRGVRVL